jgi:hypothetical protein
MAYFAQFFVVIDGKSVQGTTPELRYTPFTYIMITREQSANVSNTSKRLETYCAFFGFNILPSSFVS